MISIIKNFFSTIDISVRSIISISINDIIDILIVACLIYIVLNWIKETRAWALLKGFIVVLAISIVAFVFKLSTVSWIIENTFNVGFLALIVLFQPELRSALEQLGKGGIIKSIGNNTVRGFSERTINEIITASLAMSKVPTGALMLIEQNILLSDMEKSGILIDAEVSSQLLINIFENKTPLHDGAVIIKNNRIAAATCILPLTYEDIDKNLGTRHRAALGASEVSDAFIIVVSEETGDISIAHNGKLNRKLSEVQMKAMLLTPKTDSIHNNRKLTWLKGWRK